jgi:uncharacterized protein YndB with AHSA1/START domain
MEANTVTTITVENTINAPVELVWKYWTEPQHITQWCQANDDWHAPYADNDLQKGGSFKTTMAAKDGSFQFDFGGVYDNVEPYKLIEYTMTDGRKVRISFTSKDNATQIIETFDAENTNSIELQQQGWQAILNNFKSYTEANQ